MDKRIEYAMNTLINTEIWSTNLYLSLQVYFEGQQLPILASWLSAQAQDNMGKVYQMMNRIYHEGGAVTIHEIRRDIRQWPTPLAALNTLLEHEQYIPSDIRTSRTMPEYGFIHPFFHQGAVHKTDICKYGVYGIVAYPGHGI